MGVDDVVGVGVVLERLRHLPAVFGQDEPVHDDVFERGPVEQGGRQHQQRVEPAAGLVEPFGDEVGGQVVFDERVMRERTLDTDLQTSDFAPSPDVTE